MNFKPTWLKSIVSLIIGVIFNYVFVKLFFEVCISSITQQGFPSISSCESIGWSSSAFDPIDIGFTIVVILIVYAIWSLFQKK